MTVTERLSWSEVYCCTQHLDGLRDGFQVTVTHWPDCADCAIFLPGHGFNTQNTTHDTPEAARVYGEERARAMGAIL